ncbi:MAG: HAMP domain-containing histidine kinase [Clostridium sp.]|nr:HAMP domain-containing histidine kinase [Clostridium sp.]
MKRKNKNANANYAQLKTKLYFRLIGITVIAFIITFAFYDIVWRKRGGDWIISVFQHLFLMDYKNAYNLYQQLFRNHSDLLWIGFIMIVFCILLRTILTWFISYLSIVNQGIDALLSDDSEITFPSEMAETERKLTAVKAELRERALVAELANQRKNELVMYLAHDIRTPLTSVIGYLELMTDAPDTPLEQRAKYMQITLDKANRLEKMINEFFEITRYNLQQISINKEKIDLYYMLMQLSDELSPLLAANGNTSILKVDENLTVYGDPDKLARVFNNILKNAVAYSYPHTEIVISAFEKENSMQISFSNKGKTIPKEKLLSIFDKFYRLDEARASNTGGAGLGLAIAKEIVLLHGGTISADSENDMTIFTVTLPTAN